MIHRHRPTEWYDDCREDLERYDQDQADFADLARATEEEWRRRLDEIAPRVADCVA
jgi:hypothetical protein